MKKNFSFKLVVWLLAAAITVSAPRSILAMDTVRSTARWAQTKAARAKEKTIDRLVEQYKANQELRRKKKAGTATPAELATLKRRMNKIKIASAAIGITLVTIAIIAAGTVGYKLYSKKKQEKRRQQEMAEEEIQRQQEKKEAAALIDKAEEEEAKRRSERLRAALDHAKACQAELRSEKEEQTKKEGIKVAKLIAKAREEKEIGPLTAMAEGMEELSAEEKRRRTETEKEGIEVAKLIVEAREEKETGPLTAMAEGMEELSAEEKRRRTETEKEGIEVAKLIAEAREEKEIGPLTAMAEGMEDVAKMDWAKSLPQEDKNDKLGWAIRDNDAILVKKWLEVGANPRETFDKTTHLHEAVNYGKKEEIVELLLQYNADVNAKDNKDRTALHLIIEHSPYHYIIERNPQIYHLPTITVHSKASKVGFTRLLLKYDVDVNARNFHHETPLHLASREGEYDIAQDLINADAQLEVKDRNGYTPLHKAAASGHKNIVNLLLKAGADPSVREHNDKLPSDITESSAIKKLLLNEIAKREMQAVIPVLFFEKKLPKDIIKEIGRQVEKQAGIKE